MLYDAYRLYQIERTKSPAETRFAERQAAERAAAVSGLFRAIARPARLLPRRRRAAGRGTFRAAAPAARAR